ncbi:hypothetical protein [Endozoicomonas euniceicola]|uniref:Uncharacterized protein n=1 Tax=Endozoicomonas euniceicola TaxID=1234143 RepID=A0ABY6GV81_9GAMM|nr:hypothetical protein [Endozoicomonas euniceicola]UYM16299.1 hypothetical protein NX720_26480 [Endozoicomonas euniceicola]
MTSHQPLQRTSDPFYTLEKSVRDKIDRSSSPYIGLIDDLIDPNTHRGISNALQKAGGKFGNLEAGLQKYPALFASYMIKSIQENYGKGNQSVYECLNVALGQPKTSNSNQRERESLYRTFRRACQKLQLPVSNRLFGSNYMVDTYFDQAGVPLAQIDRIREKMSVFARRNGLPDEFDPNAQRDWYTQFCNSLHAPFPIRTKRALLNDAHCHYLTEFLSDIAESESPVSDSFKFKKMTLPSLLFDGDCLTMFFPPSPSGETWKLTQDNDQQRITVGSEPHNLLIDEFGMQHMSATSSSGSKIEFTLWKDQRNNQLAIFDAVTHRYICTHSVTDGGMVLNPGRYRVLSRFETDDDWLQTEETLEDGFYFGEFQLDAGKKYQIRRGPVTFVISAHSHAVIDLNGEAFTPYSGTPFYSSNLLQVTAKLPEEWELGSDHYELVFSPLSCGQERSIPILFTESHQVTIPLTSVCDLWQGNLDRLTISLRRSGQKRALARTSCIVWFGLKALKGGYIPECSELPDNLDKKLCSNVYIDNEQSAINIKDRSVPFASLGFRLKNRELTFQFALPGTYIYLDDTHADVRRESLLTAGTVLSASYTDRRVLRIYSTEPGIVKLGNRIIYDSFEKKPWIKCSIASLLDHIDGEHNSLIFQSENYSKTLVKLVSPHHISDWKTGIKHDSIDIGFKSVSSVDSLEVAARELFSEDTTRQQFDVKQLIMLDRPEKLGGIVFCYEDPELSEYKLQLYTQQLSDGIWFLQFNARINNRWGVFSNERQDQYAMAVIIESGKICPYSEGLLNQVDELSLVAKNRLLQSTNDILRTCYDAECWKQLSWLKTIWSHLVYDPAVTSSDNVKNLLPQTEFRPDENASPSWIPFLNIGGFNPSIYAMPSASYRKIDTGNSINLRCLKGISECEHSLGEAVRNELLVDALVVTFNNKKEVVSGQSEPREFDPKTLERMILTTFSDAEWEKLQHEQRVPALGELLGGYHLAYCQQDFLYHFRRSQQGNEFLRPAMTRLANRYKNRTADVMPNLIPEGYFEYEREVVVLQEISRLASGLAKACRERSRGENSLAPTLEALRTELLHETQDITFTLSFFLAIAGKLFHYYLLLWEIYFESRDQ